MFAHYKNVLRYTKFLATHLVIDTNLKGLIFTREQEIDEKPHRGFCTCNKPADCYYIIRTRVADSSSTVLNKRIEFSLFV